jgi:hypothetical protein
MIQLQQSPMEVIHKSSHKDVNSNVFNDGYWNENGVGLGTELDTESAELSSTIRAVALHLEGTLRAAKRAHLSCCEVLLPTDLLHKIAYDIIKNAESEPCGLRGCLILLSFESGHNSASSNHQNNNSTNNNNSPATATRKIGKIKCDKNTVNTFELNLLLREESSPWYSRLPQILRNLTKGGTIVISSDYEISKKKLYRSHN